MNFDKKLIWNSFYQGQLISELKYHISREQVYGQLDTEKYL